MKKSSLMSVVLLIISSAHASEPTSSNLINTIVQVDGRDHSSVIALVERASDKKSLVDSFDGHQNALLVATNPLYIFGENSIPFNIRRTKNIVCTLVNAGADLNSQDKSNKNTALINLVCACIADKSHARYDALFPSDIPSIIAFLVKNGASATIANEQGKTPIALVADQLQNAEMIDDYKTSTLRYVKELLEDANKNAYFMHDYR